MKKAMKILSFTVGIFFYQLLLSTPTMAGMVFEEAQPSGSGSTHYIIRRFYTDADEARTECDKAAKERAPDFYCYGPSPNYPGVSISNSWNGWFGCASGCKFYPNVPNIYLSFDSCSRGYRYISPWVCQKERLITIDGPSSTFALPQGPTLLQEVSITDSRGSISQIPYTIELFDNGVKYHQFNGTTDNYGKASFKYVPPYFRSANVLVKATCYECDNTDSKTIIVNACELQQCAPK